MANRFPLIVDSSSQLIKELVASDNLDLASSGIVNVTSIGATNISVTGIVTATTFVGALTGNATGLSGTPNISVGIVTASSFVGALTGTAATANALNTSNSYQVAALGIGQAAGTGTILDLAGRYAQTSIAVSALNIDCSLGNYFTKTISSNSTFTFSNIPASRSYSFTLCVTHDSGTITWPASVKWPKNTAPTLNTYKNHKFMFSTYNGGTVFYGAALVDFTY